ncbi:MAG: hypothetical protein ACYTG5_10195 [Planctomycetota bacterium]|jgi:hypothetical protein
MITLASLSAGIFFTLGPQGDGSSQEDALQTFAGLSNLQKASVIRRIERNLLWAPNPAISRIRELGKIEFELPAAREGLPVAPDTPVNTVVEDGDGMHQALRQDFPEVPFLPDLHKRVEYDWFAGRVVLNPPLSYEQVFANYLAGYAPGSDAAVANIIDAADAEADAKLRLISVWFAHRYVSREGVAYLAISQYEMWHAAAAELLTIGDYEAVRFARTILEDSSYRPPLAADHTRDALYALMGDAFLRLRKHRSLCESLAAGAIREKPEVDSIVEVMVPRMHFLLAWKKDSMDEVLELFAGQERDPLLAMLDGRINNRSTEDWMLRDDRAQQLGDMAKLVRKTALQVLAEVAGE